ncbi:hypothetical protein D9M68_465830 [compost metagenome]
MPNWRTLNLPAHSPMLVSASAVPWRSVCQSVGLVDIGYFDLFGSFSSRTAVSAKAAPVVPRMAVITAVRGFSFIDLMVPSLYEGTRKHLNATHRMGGEFGPWLAMPFGGNRGGKDYGECAEAAPVGMSRPVFAGYGEEFLGRPATSSTRHRLPAMPDAPSRAPVVKCSRLRPVRSVGISLVACRC